MGLFKRLLTYNSAHMHDLARWYGIQLRIVGCEFDAPHQRSYFLRLGLISWAFRPPANGGLLFGLLGHQPSAHGGFVSRMDGES